MLNAKKKQGEEAIQTSTILPSGYMFGSKSNTTTIFLKKLENFRSMGILPLVPGPCVN
jgi:hypothetical protein